MKLMIRQTICITEAMEAELSRLADEIGESKQTAIRLAIREGIELVRRKFGEQPKESKNEQQIHSGPVCGQAGGTENEGRSGSVGGRDTL